MNARKTITLRLALDVTYDLEHPESISQARMDCAACLDRLVEMAAGEGLLTGDIESISVDTWEHRIEQTGRTGTNVAVHPAIPALMTLDNQVAESIFDATAWFEQASDEEIRQLFDGGLIGSYPSDAVAEFCAKDFPDLATLFDVMHRLRQAGNENLGFECAIDEEAARAWISANRPHFDIDGGQS